MESPVFHFVPFVFCPVTENHWQEFCSVFFILPHQVFIHLDKIPLRLCFGQNNPSSLSLSSYQRCFTPFIIFMVFFWSLLVHVCLILGHQMPDPAFQVCLTSAEQRRGITSLGLLVILCLMQPRRLLAFVSKGHGWLMVNLSPRCPRSFAAELLSRQTFCCMHWCLRLFLSRGRTWCIHLLTFFFVELHEVPVGPFVGHSSEVPLNGITSIWCIIHSPQICILYKFAEGAPCPFSWALWHCS